VVGYERGDGGIVEWNHGARQLRRCELDGERGRHFGDAVVGAGRDGLFLLWLYVDLFLGKVCIGWF
jgi:hypothetical protein